jgi:hypothetical protein
MPQFSTLAQLLQESFPNLTQSQANQLANLLTDTEAS